MNIIKLIEKLNSGSISADELKKLNKLLQDNSSNIDQVFNEQWKMSSIKEISEFKLKNQFNTLTKKLELEKPSPQTKNKNIYKSLIGLMKYAAILILGSALSWILIISSDQYIKKDSLEKNIHDIQVANGSKSEIKLPDGSVVHLNSGSRLKYSMSYGISDRKVMLEGEGFFDVSKNKKLPFYVQTKYITVKALGTSFNVKSYPGDEVTETTLLSGKVEIYKSKSKGKSKQKDYKLATLNPNEIAIISNSDDIIEKSILNNTDALDKKSPNPSIIVEKKIKPEIYTDWRNEILVYDNEEFVEIIKKLERWYNVKITLQYTDISHVRFSGKFDRESIQDVLSALQLIQPFKFDINKNTITIYK